MSKIKIGWANADITPIGVIGNKASVIGQFHERITSQVHDIIQATVLVIEDENNDCAAIVSLDLALVSDRMMAVTREKLKSLMPDFPVEHLIMAATHTHTSVEVRKLCEGYAGGFIGFACTDPDVISDIEYMEFLCDQIAEAVANAWIGRKFGGIAFRLGRIALPHCRRLRYKDGTAQMYGDSDSDNFLRVEGNADNGTEYLITYDEKGKMTGVLINLACPAQILESKTFISADIWGEVRKQWSECPFVLPLCGAAGDITMRDLVRRGRMEKSMRDIEGMEDLGRRIIRESKYVLSTVKKDDIEYDLPVFHISKNIKLPISTVTKEQYDKAQKELEEFNNEYEANGYALQTPDSIPIRIQDRYHHFVMTTIIKRYKLQQESTETLMEFHALRLGSSVMVTNNFELYQDYGMQIKARSPFLQTFISQLSCGHKGYLSTPYALSGGGYGSAVISGMCGPEGGDALVEKTLEAINEIYSL
jgi:hypothetical protein